MEEPIKQEKITPIEKEEVAGTEEEMTKKTEMGAEEMFERVVLLIDRLGDKYASSEVRRVFEERRSLIGDLKEEKHIYDAYCLFLNWAQKKFLEVWRYSNIGTDESTKTPPEGLSELLAIAEEICEPIWSLKRQLREERYWLRNWQEGKHGWQADRNAILKKHGILPATW